MYYATHFNCCCNYYQLVVSGEVEISVLYLKFSYFIKSHYLAGANVQIWCQFTDTGLFQCLFISVILNSLWLHPSSSPCLMQTNKQSKIVNAIQLFGDWCSRWILAEQASLWRHQSETIWIFVLCGIAPSQSAPVNWLLWGPHTASVREH